MSFVADLEKILGASLITDPDITATYSKDQAPSADLTTSHGHDFSKCCQWWSHDETPCC